MTVTTGQSDACICWRCFSHSLSIRLIQCFDLTVISVNSSSHRDFWSQRKIFAAQEGRQENLTWPKESLWLTPSWKFSVILSFIHFYFKKLTKSPVKFSSHIIQMDTESDEMGIRGVSWKSPSLEIVWFFFSNSQLGNPQMQLKSASHVSYQCLYPAALDSEWLSVLRRSQVSVHTASDTSSCFSFCGC